MMINMVISCNLKWFVKHINILLGIFIITLFGCSVKYTIQDNSTLKAVPLPPLKAIGSDVSSYQNSDLKIISQRLDGSSFYGFMKIENLKGQDVIVKWDRAVFVDESRVANPLGVTRQSIIPAGTSAETRISVDSLSRGRNIPFLPYYEQGSFSSESRVFTNDEGLCCAYTFGLYNLFTYPFKYPAAKERAKKDVLRRYNIEQQAIDAYNNREVMIRVPYSIDGVEKKVELRYKMVGKKEPYTVADQSNKKRWKE